MNFENQKNLVVYETIDYRCNPVKTSLRDHDEEDINQFLLKYPQFTIKDSHSHYVYKQETFASILIPPELGNIVNMYILENVNSSEDKLQINTQLQFFLTEKIISMTNHIDKTLKDNYGMLPGGPNITRFEKEREYYVNLLTKL